MPFFRWLRSNSEHALLRDAQRRMAAKYDANPPARPHGRQGPLVAPGLRARLPAAPLGPAPGR